MKMLNIGSLVCSSFVTEVDYTLKVHTTEHIL